MIATRARSASRAALAVISVPAVASRRWRSCCRRWPGHLFGYEAALAIDAPARPLREARAAIETRGRRRASPTTTLLARLAPGARAACAGGSSTACAAGAYDGHLEASTAVRLASLLRYATRRAPLDAYQIEHGKVGTPSAVVEDLTAALTRAIEELTRPGRRDQAPGQDRHGRHLAAPTRRCSPCRWSRRCSPPARRATAQLPHAAHAGRPRPGGRGGHRLHPLPHRRRPARRAGDDLGRRSRNC